MFEKIEELAAKYEELGVMINDPDVIADNAKWRELMKEYSDITPIVEKYNEYKQAKQTQQDALEMLESENDEDFKAMLKTELSEAKEKEEVLKNEIKLLLLPKDPNDEKNVIMEIRGGAGGDEANIFAGDLFRMYSRYAERRGWKVELMSAN